MKHALIDRGMTQQELIAEVRERTGMYLDNAYLGLIFNSNRRPIRIVSAIEDILEIRDDEQTPSQ